jgi:Uma2 family endonuclease
MPFTQAPLESGDKLTRAEFEQIYQKMPNVKKAELIEGTVYMASPLRAKAYGKPHAQMMGWLTTYEAATPGVEALDNATVRLDADNEPQPDALLRLEQGGQSKISTDDYVEGAPELIVEIAASSASLDLNEKLKAYRPTRYRNTSSGACMTLHSTGFASAKANIFPWMRTLQVSSVPKSSLACG